MHLVGKGLFAASLLAVISACGPVEGDWAEALPQGGLIKAQREGDSKSKYPSMHLRGTHNSWAATPMQLVSDHEWSGEATFAYSANQRFKFDVHGNWAVNFGDNNGDQVAEKSGRDIAIAGGKTYVIHFNDSTRFYWYEERTYQAEVSYRVPAGVDAQALVQSHAMLSKDGENYGWNYIYTDETHAMPFTPLSGLVKGSSYKLSLDVMINAKRYVGEVAWTVDGTVDPINLEMVITEGSTADYGTVVVTVLSDRWDNGLVSSPFANMGVFLGDWHAGNSLGYTDQDGKLTVSLLAGEQLLNVMAMTSSHSLTSAEGRVNVVAGETVSLDIHVAILGVVVNAYANVGFGNALYVTGASDYLGNWQSAMKMTYSTSCGCWTFRKNLPLSLPFKIVKGPWVDGDTIATSQVQWEQGPNRTVTPPSGYYETVITANPQF